MKLLKIFYLFFTFYLLSENIVFSQTNNLPTRKRALYKTFDEFINNKPTLKDSFLIKYISRTKTDTTILKAKYLALDETSFPIQVWGFCDGTNVFIRTPQSIFNNENCLKLDHIGQFSFFTSLQKSGSSFGPTILSKIIIATVTTVLSPKDYVIYLIDNKGKIKYLNEDVLRKYLKEFPQLLASFNKDFDKVFPEKFYDDDHFVTDEEDMNRMNVLKEYLIKLDNAKTLKLKDGQ